jgi:hypothetical protein
MIIRLPMSRPTNRDEVIDYVLRKLGAPVLQINVDPDQVEDRVEEAWQFFQDFHFEATERILLVHPITEEDMESRSIIVPETVQAVFQVVIQPLGSGGVNNMFSLDYHMRVQSLNDIRGGNWIAYQMAQSHLSMIRNMMQGVIGFRFSRYKHELNIDARWDSMAVGESIIVEAQGFLDPDEYRGLWSDKMLLKLATAYVKQQWGTNMKKFTGMQLPGGVEMSGQQIYDEATAEIEKLEEDIRNSYQIPAAMFVG